MNAELNAQVKMNTGFLSMDGDDENEEAKYSLAYQKAQGKRAEMQVLNTSPCRLYILPAPSNLALCCCKHCQEEDVAQQEVVQ